MQCSEFSFFISSRTIINNWFRYVFIHVAFYDLFKDAVGSLDHIIQMIRWLTNNELKNMPTELMSWQFPRQIEENLENLTRYPVTGPWSEYEAGMLITRPCSDLSWFETAYKMRIHEKTNTSTLVP